MRFFFVLTALARISITIGLLERPLVVGLIIGFVTGRLESILPLALVLELFWLDVIRLGAIAPPSGAFSLLLLFPLTVLLPLEQPGQLAVPLLLCLPLAYGVSWLEKRQRQEANAYADRVRQWCVEGQGLSPSKVIGRVLWRKSWTHLLLYAACFSGVYGLCRMALHYGGLLFLPHLSWNVLYGMGLMGAVLALRIHRAYVLLSFTLVVLLFAHM